MGRLPRPYTRIPFVAQGAGSMVRRPPWLERTDGGRALSE